MNRSTRVRHLRNLIFSPMSSLASLACLASLALLVSLTCLAAPAMADTEVPFSRGINLTNWFQADSAQQINFKRYTRKDFERIRNLGADVIRLPINLHYMTKGAPEYRLDPLFLSYLDQVVDWAEELQIHLLLDNHSFDPAVNTDPNVGVILEKVWLQMAEHFEHRSEFIYYEILNEPHGIDDAVWNAIQQDIVAAIRTVDTKHTIVIGGAGWNSYNNLAAMPVYADDNLIYTFHFYDPFLFTHQGASWVAPLDELGGVPFPYRAEDMPPMPESFEGHWLEGAYNSYAQEGTVARMRELLDIAVAFRDQRQVPVFLGELGVYVPNSDPVERVAWYREVREYLEEKDIAWTAWDYHGGFGLFQPGSQGEFDHDLNVPLLEALGFTVPPQSPRASRTESVGFALYGDAVAEQVASEGGGQSGELNLASSLAPWDGNYAIQWQNAKQYQAIGFDFLGDKDLGFLAVNDYALDLAVRGATPGVSLAVRFIDTDTQDPNDHPWRMQVNLDGSRVNWNGNWQRVRIPLTEFADVGAWEDGQWFNSQGAFDWTAVDKLEIVSEAGDLPGVKIWFDNIQLARIPAGPEVLTNDVAVNGLFYDPATPGHGFDFNVHQAGLTIFYYGHTSSGERLWLISENFRGDIGFQRPLELDFFEVANGSFGAPQPPESPWGTITFTLSSCSTAHAEFDGLDGQADMDLVRLTGMPGSSCSLQ